MSSHIGMATIKTRYSLSERDVVLVIVLVVVVVVVVEIKLRK